MQQNERKRREMRYLSTGDVARLFEVAPTTVARWARQRKLPCLTTPSGRRKFSRRTIEELIEDGCPDG